MKLVAESLKQFLEVPRIDEFDRKGDPKRTMGIGLENMIRDWMRKNTHYNVDDKEAQYSWRKKPTKYSLLWLCVRMDKPEWVKALLDSGYDVDENNGAALRWACGLNYPEMVDILLAAGANPDFEGPSGDNEAYNWAKREGYTEILKKLEQAKGYQAPQPEEPIVKPPVPEIPQRAKPVDYEDEETEEDDDKGGWI